MHSLQAEDTCFDILSPYNEETIIWQPTPAIVALAVETSRLSRTVLIVDDDAPARRLAERVLLGFGWQVVAAYCAEDALELVDVGGLGNALACVISDVTLPGLEGLALVRTLREEQVGLPAILMSSYADPGLRRKCQAANIRFLLKPFGREDLTAAVMEVRKV